MAKPNNFDADRLREMIESGKNALKICGELSINKPTLKIYLTKLIMMDEKFYKINGMKTRITTPKVTKMGFKLSLPKMESYGFAVGDHVVITKQADGELLIKKK